MFRQKIPSYRLHRPSGRAVVTLHGKDVYLGAHGSPASHTEYKRVIAEWLATGRETGDGRFTVDLTVNEVLLAYLGFAETYYRDGNGCPTLEIPKLKNTLVVLHELY